MKICYFLLMEFYINLNKVIWNMPSQLAYLLVVISN